MKRYDGWEAFWRGFFSIFDIFGSSYRYEESEECRKIKEEALKSKGFNDPEIWEAIGSYFDVPLGKRCPKCGQRQCRKHY